jgi:hypothetical protein
MQYPSLTFPHNSSYHDRVEVLFVHPRSDPSGLPICQRNLPHFAIRIRLDRTFSGMRLDPLEGHELSAGLRKHHEQFRLAPLAYHLRPLWMLVAIAPTGRLPVLHPVSDLISGYHLFQLAEQ